MHLRRDSRTRETVLLYRYTYGRDEKTRWTLARTLESAGLFKRIDTEEQRVLHNTAVYLLENMGLTQGENYDKLVNLLFTLSIPDEAIDK